LRGFHFLKVERRNSLRHSPSLTRSAPFDKTNTTRTLAQKPARQKQL